MQTFFYFVERIQLYNVPQQCNAAVEVMLREITLFTEEQQQTNGEVLVSEEISFYQVWLPNTDSWLLWVRLTLPNMLKWSFSMNNRERQGLSVVDSTLLSY